MKLEKEPFDWMIFSRKAAPNSKPQKTHVFEILSRKSLIVPKNPKETSYFAKRFFFSQKRFSKVKGKPFDQMKCCRKKSHSAKKTVSFFIRRTSSASSLIERNLLRT